MSGAVDRFTGARSDFEDFLYHEAALLDEWRLDEWLALFTTDAIYEVPTAGAADDASSSEELFYIADSYQRLVHRVVRLNNRSAHSEFPRSETARAINNVRILRADSDEFEIACTFTTFRSKHNRDHLFFGHMRYILRKTHEGLRIRSKRVFLDMSSLVGRGRVSILL